MNQSQNQFFQFFIEPVKPECEEQAKELLAENFARQQNGTFNKEYLAGIIPTMLSYVKEESKEEITAIMNDFSKRF
ncbi:MAG: hypothetical protein E7256_06085 [Lachnospiraceae bacterium]|nr:hypothetical protein [Lachnospiraceae bacterium]